LTGSDKRDKIKPRDYRYCPWCSSPLEEKDFDGRKRLKCPSCDFVWYKNPVPAAGAIVYKEHGLLMVKRKFEPASGDWSLPAGFMEYDESPAECCIREIKEETGLDIRINRLFRNYKAGDDPRTMVVLILYLAEITGGRLEAGDDAAEVGFFGLEKLPSNIAFSAHRTAIADFADYLESGRFPDENAR
jgi:8-oxo-dGTP diphosphatase